MYLNIQNYNNYSRIFKLNRCKKNPRKFLSSSEQIQKYENLNFYKKITKVYNFETFNFFFNV